jgi:hypothetical protein
MDLAEAAYQARMSICLGDEQLDIDAPGRMDDRPRQAAAQSPGRIDRREAANVLWRRVGCSATKGASAMRGSARETGSAMITTSPFRDGYVWTNGGSADF